LATYRATLFKVLESERREGLQLFGFLLELGLQPVYLSKASLFALNELLLPLQSRDSDPQWFRIDYCRVLSRVICVFGLQQPEGLYTPFRRTAERIELLNSLVDCAWRLT
jgi:hypothetical protein